MAGNGERLLQAVADALKVDVASVDKNSSQDTLEGWDSLGMINLVAELERVFEVQFDILEISDFRNISIIKSILAEKGIRFD